MIISLPNQLPDELFFSRIARYVALSGISTSDLQQQLFNNSRISIHPLIPPLGNNGVNTYSESLDARYQQTLGPLFQAGLPAGNNTIKSIMASNNASMLSRFWKLPNQEGQQKHSLKSCAKCFFEDINEHGIPYWHRSHQIPNVFACHLHGIVLDKQILPNRYHLAVGLPSPSVIIHKAMRNDIEYAQFCANFIRESKFYTKEELISFILKRLNSLGFTTKGNCIKRTLVCNSLFLNATSISYEQDYFVPISKIDFRFIRSLLSPIHFSHPGRFCIFLYWLSQQVRFKEGFVLYYKPSRPLKNDIEEQVISLLNLGNSLNAIANLINKSRTYVKSLALKHEFTDRLRPKRIDMNMRQKIIKMAQSGWHRRAIANQFSISNGSVEIIISSSTELVIRRRRCKFESRRRRYRLKIRRFVDKTPNIIRQDVFKNCNAEAHWLLRHDKSWFLENIPMALTPMIRV